MEKHLNPEIERKLQQFLNGLRSRIPVTQFLLQIQGWPSKENTTHHLVLKVAHPAFQFDVHAGGDDLDTVLNHLEESCAQEMSQRKAAYFMAAEGIELESSIYSRYLQ